MSQREITRHELEMLKQVFQITENGLLHGLPSVLRKFYDEDKIFATNDYIYVVGDQPVALVAHLDTVHPAPPTDFFHDKKKGLLWTPEGLGADDRAGVFAILTLIERGYRPSIIFCTQEEVGGMGARAFIQEWEAPVEPVNFLIELDRQGTQDAVYYDSGNQEFESFISSYGFVTEWGTFSDISIIAPAWNVAAVNLSIGYFDEHTRTERLFYRPMFRTIDRVGQILESALDVMYDFQMVEYTYGGKYYDYIGDDALLEKYGILRETDKTFMCDGCGLYYPKDSKIIAMDEDDPEEGPWNLCPECANQHIFFCEDCGTPILDPQHRSHKKKCKFCKAGVKVAYGQEARAAETA